MITYETVYDYLHKLPNLETGNFEAAKTFLETEYQTAQDPRKMFYLVCATNSQEDLRELFLDVVFWAPEQLAPLKLPKKFIGGYNKVRSLFGKPNKQEQLRDRIFNLWHDWCYDINPRYGESPSESIQAARLCFEKSLNALHGWLWDQDGTDDDWDTAIFNQHLAPYEVYTIIRKHFPTLTKEPK